MAKRLYDRYVDGIGIALEVPDKGSRYVSRRI